MLPLFGKELTKRFNFALPTSLGCKLLLSDKEDVSMFVYRLDGGVHDEIKKKRLLNDTDEDKKSTIFDKFHRNEIVRSAQDIDQCTLGGG